MYCRSMDRSSALGLKSVEERLVSLYRLIMFVNPVYIEAQQLTKSFHRFSAGLSSINMAFRNPFFVLTTWKTGVWSNHIRSISISLLNTMFSLGMMVRHLNGGIAYSENC